ncbi:hypothetical protein [Paenibacillus donghaensis]|uniref:Uncharacterized protein n=1 Tax=Paenibacillus donghaensis TaxID=414771 RepID=A0A2Z2KTC9_9BACL|nr:hypothetical protein [Paenibacillus donghaensis]ASA22648.1 hypothetical protein B9T62_18750 [Paenibacillus donghaensis]
METVWRFIGENAKAKLEPFEEVYRLIHTGTGRKGEPVYDMYLEEYEQYEDLEKLANSLNLDLRIRIGAEWLACLYTDKFGFSIS